MLRQRSLVELGSWEPLAQLQLEELVLQLNSCKRVSTEARQSLTLGGFDATIPHWESFEVQVIYKYIRTMWTCVGSTEECFDSETEEVLEKTRPFPHDRGR